MKVISTYTGDSPYATAAQEYAIQLASRLQAHLRIITSSGSRNNTKVDNHTASLHRIQADADKHGIHSESIYSGNNFTERLIKESRITDMIVLGIPVQNRRHGSDDNARFIEDGLTVIENAQCAVMAINPPVKPFKRILLFDQGESSDVAARKMTGLLAEKFHAKVLVLTIGHELAYATERATETKNHLDYYHHDGVETYPETEHSGIPEDVIAAARQQHTDLVVIGASKPSFFQRTLNIHPDKQTAIALECPLLIAR